jgi:ubiquinone/menaquinone biosynthesis C-methylase UbiE
VPAKAAPEKEAEAPPAKKAVPEKAAPEKAVPAKATSAEVPPAKKTPAAKKAVPEKAVPEKAVPEKVTAKKAAAKKAAKKAPAAKAAPEEAAPEKVAAPAKAAPEKAAPAKAAPEKVAAPAKVAPAKAVPEKAVAAKAAPAKAAPEKVAAPAKVAPAKVAPAAAVPVAAVASPAAAAVETPAPGATPDARADGEPAALTPAVTAVPEPAHEPPPAAASAADVRRAWGDNRLAQVLYHDWEAGTYDDKWSISFDERCISYARDRLCALLGPEVLRTEPWPYPKALEIGAGTGFFSLNLRQAGVLDAVHVTDVSAGMVDAARENARRLGFEVEGAVAGAESLPYDDGTFDVVVGHAVLHHIPDVEAALREVLRVLKPGGRFAIAGEPTRIGDWYARRLGRVTWKLTTTVTHLPPLRERWAKTQEELDASSRAAALESVVDLHTFVPEELATTAERAGAVDVHTQTEELLAAFLGWPVRTFESAVNPERLGWGWAMFAYRSWQRLSGVDRALSRVLPAGVFYNVGVTGTKPVR